MSGDKNRGSASITTAVVINLIVFVGIIATLARLRRPTFSLSRQILTGLVIGAVYGLLLQAFYADNPGIQQDTLRWTNVVGTGYVSLLRMTVMPLVLVMIVAAVIRMRGLGALTRIGGTVVGLLVGTTMIAALVGIFIAGLSGLTTEGLTEGARELASAEEMEDRLDSIADLGLPEMLVQFIPTNIFADLTDARPTSVIAVVVFGILLGIAALMVAREDETKGSAIVEFVETATAVIMKLVRLVMLLTPYGILALMAKVVAGSSLADILALIKFVVASYVAIVIMFAVHAGLLMLNGVDVRNYFRKVWPVLTFAFASRSSAATIPLNVETQVDELKLPRSVASVSASFGATIGQNGCAGIYPAMLATMIAPSMGINPLQPMFVVQLVSIVAISSFGVAGVGGGATFAALIVLPAMGMPITLVALLISVEPLIDMARTALNVNGAMTASVITTKLLKIERPDRAAAGAAPVE